jgi:hypothetical protein
VAEASWQRCKVSLRVQVEQPLRVIMRQFGDTQARCRGPATKASCRRICRWRADAEGIHRSRYSRAMARARCRRDFTAWP